MKKFLLRVCIAVLLAAVLSALCAARDVIPGGHTIGLYVQTEGVAVVEVCSETAKKAGLRAGDVILAVDGKTVSSIAVLSRQVEQSTGRALRLRVLRGETEEAHTLAPQKTDEGWRLGLRVRDSVSGIGTVTFIDPETGAFGALGHGIGDGKTLLPVRDGSVVASEVASVQRGASGKPGALQGLACGRGTLGCITSNTARGIFGVLDSPTGQCVTLAEPGQAHTGAAVIRANVRGNEVEEFDVTICTIDPTGERNLLLQVSDPALLALTGGIVQGMGLRYNRDNTGNP